MVGIVPRLYSVVYGGITISDAASGYALEGPVLPRFRYRETSWSFGVVVYGTTQENLETLSAALIAEFQKPRQDLTITLNNKTYSYSEAAKTGYEMAPSIERDAGGPFDSMLTREFSCSVSLTEPAILASDDGVFDYSYNHSIGPDGIRQLSLTGIITTDGTLAAEAQYEAKIAAIVNAVQNAAESGVTWTEETESRGIERFDHEMTFTRSYRRQLYKDSLSAFNVEAIKFPQLAVAPTLIYEANAIPGITRPVELKAQYSATVDAGESTDLTGLWEAHVVPLLEAFAAEVATIYSTDPPITQEITPTFDPTGNSISGFIRFVAFGPQRIFAITIEEEVAAVSGALKIPVYGVSPYERARLPGVATAKASIIVTASVQGEKAAALAAANSLSTTPAGNPPGEELTFDSYRLLSREEAGQLGASGGGWSLEDERIAFVGPNYVGDPATPVTTCVLSRIYDYDKDPSETIPDGGGGDTGGIFTRAR